MARCASGGFPRQAVLPDAVQEGHGLTTGARVLPSRKNQPADRPGWLGRMVNGLGEPIDGLGKLGGDFRSTRSRRASIR
jgi:flagellum-specific ATP synthase